jgi:sensitive to high expression protein 9, mitochondrial
MQPFGRTLARAALGHARLGLLPLSTPTPSTRLIGMSRFQTCPAACLQCRVRTVEKIPARFYSSKPSDNNKPASTAPEREASTDGGSEPSPSSSSSVASELPSAYDRRRSAANQKFSDLMDNLQSRALTASQTLNELTGYSAIEEIKRDNANLEVALADAHSRVRNARQAFKTSNAKRSATQREVTTLLARKETWSPTDLERFTELYRTDHVLEGEVASAQEALTEAETDEQSLSQRLNAGILKRYHEEQIWSDRIRRASTWGTWGLMGMNFLLFVILQFVAEPWKRRRLVRGVVAEEKEVLEEVRSELTAVKLALERAEQAATELEAHRTTTEDAAAPAPTLATGPPMFGSWKEFLLEPASWRAVARDLYSDRPLDLRMRDASTLALEGAAAGAVVSAGILWALLRSAR